MCSLVEISVSVLFLVQLINLQNTRKSLFFSDFKNYLKIFFNIYYLRKFFHRVKLVSHKHLNFEGTFYLSYYR